MGSAARRGAAWALGIGAALLLLAAVEASTAPEAGGLRASRDAVRLLLAFPLAVGALVAARAGARSEAIGLAVASAVLALAAVCDAFAARWIAAGDGRSARLDRDVAYRFVVPWIVLGLPGWVGARALRIPPLRVFGARTPSLRAFGVAAVLGVALFPLLNAASVYGNAALRAALVAGAPPDPRGWPSLANAIDRPFFPLTTPTRFLQLAARLAFFFPLAEACLHGVLRQAFLRWGRVPFVVGTAFLAVPLVMDGQTTFGVFGGMLVTGVLAATTGSSAPGLAFWYALFLGQVLWMRIA
jgi:hypothetical protein